MLKFKSVWLCHAGIGCGNEVEADRQCYQVIDTELTWYEARNDCLERGGDLMTSWKHFGSTGQYELPKNVKKGAYYWIGLRKITWSWASLQEFSRLICFAIIYIEPDTYWRNIHFLPKIHIQAYTYTYMHIQYTLTNALKFVHTTSHIHLPESQFPYSNLFTYRPMTYVG